MDKIVGIGEFIISNNKDDIIKTFALASCVAVTAYSRTQGVSGMIHIALPAEPSGENKINRVGYYADTGLPTFINEVLYHCGSIKENLSIGIYGGAISVQEDIFKIGPKNVAIVKKILRDFNLFCSIEETGNSISRTIYLDVATGIVNIMRLPIVI